MARELGRRGYQVVICARTEKDLDRAAASLRAEGHRIDPYMCDVSKQDAVETMVAWAEREIGPVEVMVCVAGIIQVGPLTATSRDQLDAAIATMLWGPINTALAVTPAMQQRQRGRIGIITSVGGQIAAPHLLAYSTAKFGAVGFSRGLRSELAPDHISVTTVTPGLMRTGSHLRALFAGDHEREFAWFATAASLPVLSIDADRAARRIVTGIVAGRSSVILTPLAMIAPVVAAVAPGATAALLALVHRLLPAAPADQLADAAPIEGRRAETKLSRSARSIVARLTVLGRRAAERSNQFDAPT